MNKLATYVAVATLSLIAAPSIAGEAYKGIPGMEFNEAIICDDPRLINDLMDVVQDLGDFNLAVRGYEHGGHCGLLLDGEIILKKPWGSPSIAFDNNPVETWIIEGPNGDKGYAIIWPTLLRTINNLKGA